MRTLFSTFAAAAWSWAVMILPFIEQDNLSRL